MPPKKILYTIILLEFIIITALVAYPQRRIINGLKVGEVDISNLTYTEAVNRLKLYEKKPIYLNFPNSSLATTYEDIGVTFNHSRLKKYLVKCNFIIFCTRNKNTTNINSAENIVEIDTNKFNKFVESINKDLSGIADTPIVDLINFEFSGIDKATTVEIDKDNLLKQLTQDNIYKDSLITLRLNRIYEGDSTAQSLKTKELINKVSAQPFVVKFGRTEIKLSTEDLLGFLVTLRRNNQIFVYISDNAVADFIDRILNTIKVAAEIDKAAAVDTIRRAILMRVPEEKISRAIILPLKGGPSTDGSLYNKYLELNKSQQRLYRFENGKLTKTYVISTGVTWETPVGNFRVLKKTPMTISYFGEWWMPWYMPIGTVNGPYFFGFHEVPYHRDINGNIYSRDPETIGSPATGGCIQLLKGEAEELYNWADIGTPVIIHD